MGMIELVGSFAVGAVAGYVAKDRLSTSNNNSSTEKEQLYKENEKLARRNK